MNSISGRVSLAISVACVLINVFASRGSLANDLVQSLRERHGATGVIKIELSGSAAIEHARGNGREVDGGENLPEGETYSLVEKWTIDVPRKWWRVERTVTRGDRLVSHETQTLRGNMVYSCISGKKGKPASIKSTPARSWEVVARDYPISLMLGVLPVASGSLPFVEWLDPENVEGVRIRARSDATGEKDRLSLEFGAAGRLVVVFQDSETGAIGEANVSRGEGCSNRVEIEYEEKNGEYLPSEWKVTTTVDCGVGMTTNLKVRLFESSTDSSESVGVLGGVASSMPWNDTVGVNSKSDAVGLANKLSKALGDAWTVVLDEGAFAAAGMSISDTLELGNDQEMTVRDLLYDGLRSNRLDFIASDGQVRIVPRILARTRFRSLAIVGPVEDWIDAEVVMGLICEEIEPYDWDFIGGVGQISAVKEEGVVLVSHAPSDIIRVNELVSQFEKGKDE